jgi:hypothetical protein
MITVLGVSINKEDILKAFNIINRGDTCNMELMGLIMPEDDVGYFTSTAPKAGNSYDFKQWTEAIFAR